MTEAEFLGHVFNVYRTQITKEELVKCMNFD